MQPMSETYRSKRERWQRLLESLPNGLREYVAIRNVEAVAALSPQAQARLLEAIQAGLKRIPVAVERLKQNPDLSVGELLEPSDQGYVGQKTEFPQPDATELIDLIQLCFPDMPRISADALANADVMNIARHVAQVHTEIFRSTHIRTDFVMLVLYGLMRQTLDQLEEIIEQTPSLRQALEKSGLPWKPNDWRK
jgi:hypothetical protein